MNQFTIGLSGHIDHGKTSIIKSLTGKNTDNLKEEIARGMTINIGFSFLSDQITLVDVPGHERFIKNMLAGINSIDYALLVIAADDGIMPQTVEHFEILKLLNIKKGSIIINKIDLVENDWLDLVESEIVKFTKDSFLENSIIHKVSTKTNEGIENLKNYLINQKSDKINKKDEIFRLFVDRSFISKGFGTVVTGTVISGSISIGDKVKILPQNKIATIRGLQSHNKITDKLNFGDRGAINFQSIDKIKIERGNHISDKNFYNCFESAFVSFKVLSKLDKNVKNNDRLRIYLGTQEVMARIFFSNIKEIEPGKKTCALLIFEKPIVVSWMDLFIARTFSPLVTIGGGKILDINNFKTWKENKKYISQIGNSKSEVELIENIIYSNKTSPFTISSLCFHLSISKERLFELIDNSSKIQILDDKWMVTLNQIDFIKNKIITFLHDSHDKNPYRLGVLKEEILNSLYFGDNFIDWFLNYLCELGSIKKKNNLYSLIDFEISLNSQEVELSNKIINLISKQNFTSFNQKDLIEELQISEKVLKRLLKILVSNNDLILINNNLIFSKKNIDKLICDLKLFFKKNSEMSIGEFKDLANTSRKYAVPLLEYFDKIGLTFRHENNRKLID